MKVEINHMILQSKYTEAFFKSLRSGGVFVNTRSVNGQDNTMVIGCGGIVDIWGKMFVEIPIRHNRYSWQLLEENPHFVISIPKPDQLQEALIFCGTKSGRDIEDKFKACNLTKIPATQVNASLIKECAYNLECRVLYKQDMIPGNIPSSIRSSWHGDDRYHTLYYGEILDCSSGD